MWRSVRYNFAQGGARQVLEKAAWRLGRMIHDESVWLLYSAESNVSARDAADTLRRAELKFDDLLRVGFIKAVAFPERIQERFRRGAVCHGFFVGENLANLAWTTNGVLELDERLTVDVPGDIGIYDCITLSEFRGRGIYTQSLGILRALYRSHIAGRIVIAVDPNNRPSIRGIERAGFARIQTISRTTVLGVSRLRVKSVAQHQ
jgi:hypothetical protein